MVRMCKEVLQHLGQGGHADVGGPPKGMNILLPRVLEFARANDTATISSLISEDPSIVSAKGQFGDTLLIKAAAAGAYPTCRLLLEAGADVNAANKHGRTPLIEACMNGKEAVVVLLLSFGADVSKCDAMGRDALGEASFGGHDGIVEALLPALDAATLKLFLKPYQSPLGVSVDSEIGLPEESY